MKSILMGNKLISILKKWDLRSMGLRNMGSFFLLMGSQDMENMGKL